MSTTAALLGCLKGFVAPHDLPDTLYFAPDLWQAMDDLWQRSVERISEGIVSEWGGLLQVWRGRLRLVYVTSGSAEGLRLIMPTGGHFVGTFHTHPHVGGHTGIGFSGADLADMANQGERISLVQSGQHTFMLLRTANTPSNLSVAEWRDRMNTRFGQAYLERRDILAASLLANRVICQELALALYYGRMFEQLVEVYRP